MNARTLPNQEDLRARRDADRAAWLGTKPRNPARYLDREGAPGRVPSRSVVAPRHVPVKLRRPSPPRTGR
jgi:hypothetical protein